MKKTIEILLNRFEDKLTKIRNRAEYAKNMWKECERNQTGDKSYWQGYEDAKRDTLNLLED